MVYTEQNRARGSCGHLYDAHSGGSDTQEALKRCCNSPSSSGTAGPPLCHSVVVFSQRDGTLRSCAGLNSSSTLPSTCNDGTVIDWGTSRSMVVGRSSHCLLQKLMKNWRDGERAATAAAMSAPSKMPQMPLIGAYWSIQRQHAEHSRKTPQRGLPRPLP